MNVVRIEYDTDAIRSVVGSRRQRASVKVNVNVKHADFPFGAQTVALERISGDLGPQGIHCLRQAFGRQQIANFQGQLNLTGPPPLNFQVTNLKFVRSFVLSTLVHLVCIERLRIRSDFYISYRWDRLRLAKIREHENSPEENQ